MKVVGRGLTIWYFISYKKAWKGALPLTLECAMMISTRNRDEKYGPPFVNSLGTFAPTLTLPNCARGTMQKTTKKALHHHRISAIRNRT